MGTESKPQPVYGKIVLSLENCLLPPEKLEKSPSVEEGLDPDIEYDCRIMGCELIQTAGILLKLPQVNTNVSLGLGYVKCEICLRILITKFFSQVAMATGQVLFQRFYYCKSFVRHPLDVTAMACVCLASKIEEAHRRIRDVINVFHHIRQVRCEK